MTSADIAERPGFKNALRVFVLVRIVLSILAFPLAPVLYKKHFVLLVLMRPTKDVLLAAGFLIRLHKVALPPVLLAAIPLAIFGVWFPYYLGRVHGKELASGDVPRWIKRFIDPDRTKKMQKLLDRKGMRLVFLGRLALFPSAVVGTAAGAGEMPQGQFLLVDGLGALASIAESVGLGYALGYAYKKAGPWLTVVAGVALAAAAFIVARFLRRD